MAIRTTGRVDVSIEDSVATLTIDNPAKRNALSATMMGQIAQALEDFRSNAHVRAVLVRGAGGVFSAGADLSEFDAAHTDVNVQEQSDRAVVAMFSALTDCRIPLIAQIERYCMGAGAALAVGCDIRIAADDAVFSIPAARMGIGYPVELTAALTRLVGPGWASEILFTARRLPAAEAALAGLVNRTVPADDLSGEVQQLASTIAANAPLTVRAAKASILTTDDPRRMEEAQRAVAEAKASADSAEGPRAFLEKRDPVFLGK